MLKNKKLQKGKGKRIKLQWQYSLLDMIGTLNNFPDYLSRQWRWISLTIERYNIHRMIQEGQNKILDEEAITRADAIINDMFFNRHFNM